MDKKAIKQIKTTIDQMKECKETIAKERDKLRKLYEEMGSLVAAVTDGSIILHYAIQGIEDAIDKYSEKV